MAIFRSSEKYFCIVSKEMLNDNRLSFESKGVMAFIESEFKDGEVINLSKLDSVHKDKGKKDVTEYLEELLEYGYLKVEGGFYNE